MTEYKELYITSTESLYPGDTEFSEVVVRLYCRDKDDNAVPVTVTGFSPYFLTRAEETEKVRPASHENLVGYEDVETDPLSERFNQNPTDLVRVEAKYPHAVKNLRDKFDKTWGADTIFTERFRIDQEIRTGVRVPTDESRDGHIVVDKLDIEPVEIKDVEPRVLTLDIETDDRGAGFPDPGEARILSIAVHDSYKDEYTVFLDCEGDDFEGFFNVPIESIDEDFSISDIGLTEPDALVPRETESQMLTAFSNYIRDTDPDIITGWNSGDGATDGFDLPHIIERMNVVGLNPARISREGEVEVKERGDKFKPSITGRALYDLMDGWGDTKFTEPDSFKLDDVAEKALDDTKIEHQDQGYYEMYQDDPVKFVNYNVKDTRLTVEINEEENVLGFKKRLKDMVGVDWNRTHQNNEFIEMSVRRKCHEHGLMMITAHDNPFVGKSGDDVNYEGAYVFPSFTGVKRNVCGVDLASLYPMSQWMLNASPDTRIEVEKGTQEWYELKDEIDGQYAEAANGQMFRTDVDGIIRELVDEYHEIKKEFKAERNSAEYGTDAWEEAAEAYSVTKTIYNCFDDQTEVMTPDGVRNITDLEVGDEVLTLNEGTGMVEKKSVEETYAYEDYDDDLIQFNSTSIDFTVTPNHKMFVENPNTGNRKFREAGELADYGQYQFPTASGTNVGGREMETVDIAEESILDGTEVRVHPDVHGRTFNSELPDSVETEYDDNTGGYFISGLDYLEHRDLIESMCEKMTTEVHAERNHKFVPVEYSGDAFIELLAWYVTEGSVYRDGNTVQVNIAQKEAGDRPAIRDMLERCGIDYKEDEPQLWFTSHVLGDVLEDLCGSGSAEKQIPDFVWQVSERQKHLLFQTLVNGDGDVSQRRYTTKSDDLRDDFLRLTAELGMSSRYKHDDDGDVWRIRYDSNNGFRPHGNCERRESEADEGVYCVKVKDNHTVLAGRNGKFQWIGQSFYGYSGWDRSPLYNPHDAAAITLTCQRVIKRTAKFFREEALDGVEVVYGDTDSNYVEFPDDWDQEKTLEYADSCCHVLTNDVYPELCEEFNIPPEDNRWEIEVEMRAERFFQSGSKKRYAYLKMWDEGDDFDSKVNGGEGKFSVTGYECVKSNYSPLTKETQENVLEQIVRGAEKADIVETVHEATTLIDAKDPNWDRIGIPQGLGQKIDPEKAGQDEYYSWSKTGDHPRGEAPRAAWFANHLLDVKFNEGDKPKRAAVVPSETVRGEEVDVIAYNDHHDLLDVDLTIDTQEMQRKCLENPLEDILQAVEIEPDAAMRGKCQTQSGLGAFM